MSSSLSKIERVWSKLFSSHCQCFAISLWVVPSKKWRKNKTSSTCKTRTCNSRCKNKHYKVQGNYCFSERRGLLLFGFQVDIVKTCCDQFAKCFVGVFLTPTPTGTPGICRMGVGEFIVPSYQILQFTLHFIQDGSREDTWKCVVYNMQPLYIISPWWLGLNWQSGCWGINHALPRGGGIKGGVNGFMPPLLKKGRTYQ